MKLFFNKPLNNSAIFGAALLTTTKVAAKDTAVSGGVPELMATTRTLVSVVTWYTPSKGFMSEADEYNALKPNAVMTSISKFKSPSSTFALYKNLPSLCSWIE